MRPKFSHPLRIFLTGALALLPLAATVLVFWWAASMLLQWVGPQSAFGRLLGRIGIGVTGSEIAGYAVGVAIVAAAVFALGLLVETRLQRGLQSVIDGILRRIPLVRNVYELTQKMVSLFSQRETDGVKSMSAVWCHFGGAPDDASDAPGRATVLGLLSTPQPVWIGGKPYVGVIVPTAPMPVGGALMFLPQHWITPAELGIEALTSIYVSMGITAGQHLPAAGPPVVPDAPHRPDGRGAPGALRPHAETGATDEPPAPPAAPPPHSAP